MPETPLQQSLRMYPTRNHRIGMRSAFMDAMTACDAIANRIRLANSGRKSSVSQIGMFAADAADRCAAAIEEMRDAVTVPADDPADAQPGAATPLADRIARALAFLDAIPDVDPARATRAQIEAAFAANQAAWAVLSEGRDPPSRRGEAAVAAARNVLREGRS